MKTLQQAREELGNAIARKDELLNTWDVQKRSATSEEDTEFDQLEPLIEQLKAEVKTLERLAQRETKPVEQRSVNVTNQFGSNIRTNSHKITKQDCQKAFRAWALGSRATDDLTYSADKLGVNYASPILKMDFNESPEAMELAGRDVSTGMSVGTAADGGYTVSTFPVQGIEIALKKYSNLREQATVVTTAQGGHYPWATNNDTGNGAHIIGENTQVSVTDPTVGQIVFNDFTYVSDMVRLSFQLLNDSSINLPSFLADRLGQRLGRRENTDMTTGGGTTLPRGILLDATDAGIVTQSSSAPVWQDLASLITQLDPAYTDNASFMMNNKTYGKLLQFANTQNTPLFMPGLDKAGYRTFDGFPIVINQAMPDWAPSATGITSPIIFGDLKKYMVRQVGEVLYKRLDERYADYGQVAFLAYHRMDAALIDAGTHPVLSLTVAAAPGSGSGSGS